MSEQDNVHPTPSSDRSGAILYNVARVAFFFFFGAFLYFMFTNQILLMLRLFGGVFAAVGVAGLAHGLWSLRMARQSEDWFPVEGVIVGSRLDVKTDQPAHVGHPTRVGEPAIDTYWPRIEFEYQFEGETYRSDRIIFANVNFPRQRAEELVAQNPMGARVQVYVDRNHPRQAVLEKGTATEAKTYLKALIAGVILTLIGLGLWFLAPHLAAR